MNSRLSELQLKRGRLLERIAGQRAALTQQVQPACAVLRKTDKVLGTVRRGVDYVAQHPSIATLAVAGLFFVKGGRVLNWSRRAFGAWRLWRSLSERLLEFGLRARL